VAGKQQLLKKPAKNIGKFEKKSGNKIGQFKKNCILSKEGTIVGDLHFITNPLE
jgi:hypothetical protein